MVAEKHLAEETLQEVVLCRLLEAATKVMQAWPWLATLNSELVTNVGLYAPVDGSLVYFFADNQFPYFQ